MHNEDAEGSGAAAIMAPLVVYLMSTRCASATPWNHRDHLRTRVAPAAAAYAARLEHPIVAVVDECSGEELPTCETLHAIEPPQLRGRRRVDGVGRPKFDFHTGDERASHRGNDR